MKMKCLECGGPMPRRAHHRALYCKPLCSREGQKKANVRRAIRYQQKLAADPRSRPKQATGAPGCGCGSCPECKIFLALQHDARDWRSRERVVDD